MAATPDLLCQVGIKGGNAIVFLQLMNYALPQIRVFPVFLFYAGKKSARGLINKAVVTLRKRLQRG